MSDHWRALRESPTPFLLGCGTLVLAAGGGLVVLAVKVDERRFLPAMAGSMLGIAFLIYLVLFLRGSAATRRAFGKLAARTPRPVRRTALAALLLTTALAIYDAAVWYLLEVRCNDATRAPTVEARSAALAKATWRRRDPLLLIPSGLFDIHAESRCRDAAEEMDGLRRGVCPRWLLPKVPCACGEEMWTEEQWREMSYCIHPTCVGHLACGDTYWQ